MFRRNGADSRLADAVERLEQRIEDVGSTLEDVLRDTSSTTARSIDLDRRLGSMERALARQVEQLAELQRFRQDSTAAVEVARRIGARSEFMAILLRGLVSALGAAGVAIGIGASLGWL